ncbi:peptidylprolyl isomerase [Neolewinella antarctica]|uniref:peptidylprolyl isomerase n=1 Tax=Neolewinella antarctica TaxID=442734 RepID=A0ABX0X8B0_9BACT|nr:peptidylprolyl isomerase [Neolewinella antarctica]NJC25465.1 cyclophilin family peptidyl-prolyl cis-trans isomerase/HEAT repeat protein [Neolewinella antarctica]
MPRPRPVLYLSRRIYRRAMLTTPSVPLLIRLVLLLGVCVLAVACVPPTEEKFEGIVVDLNDLTTRRIYEHQNGRHVDSLLTYLSHPNPSYRYQATRALGSFPELPATGHAMLIEQLADRYELVRSAAAYALGQTGEETLARSLAAAFDTLGQLQEYNAAILTAIGKTGGASVLDQVTAITTYRPADTLLRSAQVRSLLYFGRRGIRSDAADSLVLDRLLDPTVAPQTKQEASFYAQRFPLRATTGQDEKLRQALRTEIDPDLLMGVVRTLGGVNSAAARIALLRALEEQSDWRVRVEALKGLADYDYALVRPAVLQRLSDEHPLVRRQAAAYLREHGDASDATYYHRFAKDSTRTDIRYQLFGAANKYLPLYLTDYRGRINYDLRQAYATTQSDYHRAEILQALAEFPWNYRTIHDLYKESGSPVVRSAAAEALYSISEREDFAAFFRGSSSRVRLDLAGFFQEMVTSLAVGPAYHAANAIAAQPTVYGPLYPDQVWLRSALKSFKLPRELEAYYAVDAARAALAGEPKPTPQQPTSVAQAIDWEVLGAGGKDVLVRTSVGRFSLKMLPDIAPATVTNFLQRVGEAYYDGKSFHRVVPNFVAQGGGPLGDGFGAESSFVRTETPGIRFDRPGLVGMASAGKDTEGVQFFITHRAAPHLDGNYTIFAEVTSGQEVVDRITVGTIIESIEAQ